MVNYGNTKIYKIWSPLGDNIYIGCTTKKYLSQRMVQHKHNANKGSQKTNTSYIIFEEYGINNCFIELLEAKECVSKDECKMLEGKYIRELECVNKYIPDRTKKEYYETHKDKLAEWQKQYRHDNKEDLRNIKGMVCICECGSLYTHAHKSRHERTKKHLKYFQQPQ